MITHPEKLLFPEDGITKGELAGYYEAVSSVMLEHLRGRPVTMERYPRGIEQKWFIQKNVSRGFPDWLERVEVPKKGGTVQHPLVNDLRSLLWLANQNCITPHIWPSRVPALDRPDLCVLDLDPSLEEPTALFIDTGRNGFGATFAAAYSVRPTPGAPVSAPCTWDELERGLVGPRTFRSRTMRDRLVEVGDLWAEIRFCGQSLLDPMERLKRLLTEEDWNAALSSRARKPAERKASAEKALIRFASKPEAGSGRQRKKW